MEKTEIQGIYDNLSDSELMSLQTEYNHLIVDARKVVQWIQEELERRGGFGK
jgi:hypothetical protein